MPNEQQANHLWVNGVVAVRDHEPYIQLSNETGMLAQMDLASARQFADDIIQMCARTEADAMLGRFFRKLELPDAALAAMMADFREYRADLDEERGRVSGGPDREGGATD